jgi:MEMO1 family protein
MLIHPCVAGKFYPANPDVLRQNILELLSGATDKKKLTPPKAIIAPHAGYIYSGPVAASAYACLTQAKETIKRVVLLAPSHRYSINGIATTTAEFYLTPLGKIAIDQKTITNLSLSDVSTIDEAFSTEHSLEVHLPFLQVTLESFFLIPLLVGFTTPTQVQKTLESLWDGPETLIIISSDLSHYLSYKTAQSIDKKTAAAIMALNPNGFTTEDACGATGIQGLLMVAAKKQMTASQIDLRNSGDTAGPKENVVGYGAFHFK